MTQAARRCSRIWSLVSSQPHGGAAVARTKVERGARRQRRRDLDERGSASADAIGS